MIDQGTLTNVREQVGAQWSLVLLRAELRNHVQDHLQTRVLAQRHHRFRVELNGCNGQAPVFQRHWNPVFGHSRDFQLVR